MVGRLGAGKNCVRQARKLRLFIYTFNFDFDCFYLMNILNTNCSEGLIMDFFGLKSMFVIVSYGLGICHLFILSFEKH